MSARSSLPRRPPRQTVAVVTLVTAAVYGAGWVAYATAAPGWLTGAVSAAAATAALAPVLARTGPGVAAGYTLVCGVAAGGWLAYAATASPATWLAAAALAAAALVLGQLYPLVRRHQQRLAEAARLRAAEERRKAAERMWPDLLGRLGYPGLSFRGETITRSGRTIRLGLPGNGKIRYGPLAEATERIEIAARLRRGAVRFERGGRADEVLLHVAERDVLAETVPFPEDTRPLSVNQPLPVGLHEDGTVCTVTLREVAALVVGLRGSGKALALDTPVPTPDGWTTMGEIRAGDAVYDETGSPCKVTDAWDVRYGRPCYEIKFSDGSRIIADAEHQWLVDDAASRRSESAARRRGPGLGDWRSQAHKRARPRVVTTAEMVPTLQNPSDKRPSCNYSIKTAAPLKGKHAALPVPPYTLGAWLGDGWSAAGAITTADPEILTQIESDGEDVWIIPSTIIGRSGSTLSDKTQQCRLAGVAPTPCSATGQVESRGLCVNHYAIERRAGRLDKWPALRRDTATRERLASYRIGSLQVRLRELGVLHNKHIPVAYQRASEQQRRALLAGLLDTDGYCTTSGTVEFNSTRERLARDVLHLASGLGYKPTFRRKQARYNGKECGTAWTVAFTPGDKVFRLPRKASRQVAKQRSTARHRYITAIRPVPSVPVRCIAVDSPSHLYLAGDTCIPTHNSNLINVLIAQLSRCRDAVIFMIDLKGGRTALPWLRPWLEGRTRRPVIDWLATTRDEAERMLCAVLRGIDARAHSGAGGEKIIPSPSLPAVILIVEEVAVIFGMNGGPRTSLEGTTNTRLAALGTQVTQLGRSEAIDPVMVTQRGAVTMIGSADLKSQCALRIGLGVASEADARLVIPDDMHIAAGLARLVHPGSGIVQSRDGRPVPVKFYRLTHDRITAIAERAGPGRAAPDQVLAEALGEDYRQRWSAERAGHLNPLRAGPGLPAAPHSPPPPGRDTQTDREFAEIVAGLGDARKRMLQLLDAAGVMGATTARLQSMLEVEGFVSARQSLDRWLTEEETAGRVRRASHGRWKTR